MKMLTRRETLKYGVSTLGAAHIIGAAPKPLLMSFGRTPEPVPPIQDPRIKALAQRAIQAARDAGATYADVRLTFTKQMVIDTEKVFSDMEVLHTGIRALVGGYWGFAASPVWLPDEMVRLGRESARLASEAARGKPRDYLVPPSQPVIDAHWETPVEIDAFALHPYEIRDFLLGLKERILNELAHHARFGVSADPKVDTKAEFKLQEKAFASTDGSYVTQRLHWTSGVADCRDREGRVGSAAELLTLTGAGWEHFKHAPILDAINRTIQESDEIRKLPIMPLDVGRYDTVFDAASVAGLLSRTIGAATELDRCFGYEANAGGTSYLSDPAEMLGTFRVGSDRLTVVANRDEPGGVATVRWDDEGVAPTPTTLVRNGILDDFQTSRESSGWLRDRYVNTGRPFQSHGCVLSPTAGDVPTIHTANLAMQSNVSEVTLRDLEADVKNGMSIGGMWPNVDFQCVSGSSDGMLQCYEIKNGKRSARIFGAGVLFRTLELWKNILAVGGTSSKRRYGFGGSDSITKSEPVQYGAHSVTAVPITVKEVAFYNPVQR